MHRELLLNAFEKVERKLNSEGINSPSINQCAVRLSEIISETFPYGDRRLRDFYKEAKNSDGGAINIPQPQVLMALAQYLGYDNYNDFLVKNTIDEVKGRADEGKVPKKRNKLLLMLMSLFLITVIGFFGYHYFTKQRWMEWNATHYVETSFDGEKLKTGILKAYKEERIEGFRELSINCSTQFFNEDGSVRIWYGKDRNGGMEYFSSYGLHPRTNKTLRPITKYIIDKYICD